MSELPFSIDLLQSLADSRTAFLTAFFQLATFFGEVEGYVLLIAAIYVMWDKRLAFRLSVVVLLAMTLNHLLKVVVKNPRPFITEGTWTEKWAVSADRARELATEYSTPSGHAMAAAAFYSELYFHVRSVAVRVLAVFAALLIGLSRPYLGVHYLEDVLIGWLIGLALSLLLLKHAAKLSRRWGLFSYSQQVLFVVVSSVAVWLFTLVANGRTLDAQPLAFIGYAGFLTGIVIAYPLETRSVRFDPGSMSVRHKLARFAVTGILVILTLLVLDRLFALVSDDSSLAGHALQYVRYTMAGIVAMYVAPLTFTRLRLAEVLPASDAPIIARPATPRAR